MIRLLGIALCLVCAVGAQAAEQILSYDSEVEVRADGTLDVTERITVTVEGNQIRRGIYRDFPTRYRDRYGNRVVVGLEVLGVERNGNREPWFTENISNGVRINTGDDNFLPAPAEHTFTFRYRTTRQLGFFDKHDELYWNAIGTGWIFPILSGTVEARLPEPVPIDQMSAEGYTGPQGSKGQAYAAELPDAGVARWRLTQPLAPREGMTVVLTLPKGIVPAPTTQQRAAWFLRDNRGVLVAAIGFLLLLAFCFYEWRRVGRDPRKGIVIARYEPPEGHGPANLRYLQRMGYDTRCFSAAVLNLAVAGFVRISRQSRLIKKDEWRLERSTMAGVKSPSPSEAGLLDSLFAGGSLDAIDLNNKSASLLSRVISSHDTALGRVMKPRYFKLNGWSIGKALLIAVATFLLALMVSGGSGIAAIIVLGILCVITLIVFGILVRAPTVEGRKLMDEVEGFKLYLGVAERDELARVDGPGSPPQLDAKRYETLLPYAVALDVEEAWTKKFTLAVGAAAAAVAANNIGWYRGGSIGDLGSFASDIGSALSSQIASASTPPGSSSGSGGGGSSGGGGGGGGGGGR